MRLAALFLGASLGLLAGKEKGLRGGCPEHSLPAGC